MSQDEFQRIVLEKLEKIENFIGDQEKLNLLIVDELQKNRVAISQQRVLIENTMIEQSKLFQEGGKLYTDMKLNDHELAFH